MKILLECIKDMADNIELIKSCLQSIENILSIARLTYNKLDSPSENPILMNIEELNVYKILASLQTHSNQEICDLNTKIIETYFDPFAVNYSNGNFSYS
jgi:hypothetical protein